MSSTDEIKRESLKEVHVIPNIEFQKGFGWKDKIEKLTQNLNHPQRIFADALKNMEGVASAVVLQDTIIAKSLYPDTSTGIAELFALQLATDARQLNSTISLSPAALLTC